MITADNNSANFVSPFVQACTASCKKLVAKLQDTKKRILAEFRWKSLNDARMLELALNEAEALAYETDFPLLVFPVLAREKVEAVSAWNRHQQRVRRSTFNSMAARAA